MPTDPTGKFKPNPYPIMYWALAYAVIAGVILFIVFLLSQYITLFWLPVFLAGLVWGGYRNYKKQKDGWYAQTGTPAPAQSAAQEFREAVSDVVNASREVMADERVEREAAEVEEVPLEDEEISEDTSQDFNSPTPPPTPPSQPPQPPQQL